MKRGIYCAAVLAAVLVASCAGPTVVPVAPPLVKAPVKAPAVDLRPVERIVAAVDESSDELRAEVSEARAESRKLSVAISEAANRHGATELELAALKGMADATELALLEVQVVAERQKREIAGLRETLGETGRRVAAAEAERDNLRASLEEANMRIFNLTGISQAAATERDTAAAELEVANRWKWRFLWWALGASALVVAYVGLKVYLFFAKPI